jgi:hypothetical protein
VPRVHLPLYGQLKEHVSFSELRLFNECEWKWLLLKVFGLRADDRSFQMEFGKAAHSGMEVLYAPATLHDVQAATRHALSLYDASLAEMEPTLHPSDLKEARRIRDFLPRFYEDCLACPELQGIKTLRSELQLMEPIERTDGLALKFKGFIDITFVKQLKRKTVIYIADFKTCQWGWPAKKFQDIEVISQILLYKHFFCKMTGADPKNVSVAFILLKKRPKEGDLTVSVEKISAGPKATQHALDYMQRAITGMHSYSYEKDFGACKRGWTDPETQEERVVTCPFAGTPDCEGSER